MNIKPTEGDVVDGAQEVAIEVGATGYWWQNRWDLIPKENARVSGKESNH